MWIDGSDVTSLPLDERRTLLSELPLTEPLERVESLSDPLPWERALKEGWEGVIAKRRDSIYEQRRSKHWLKMKCELAQEFVVGGFTDPQGKRVGLGALLIGYYDYKPLSEPPAVAGGPSAPPPANDEATADFLFAGKIGTGFNTKLLEDLRAQLD